MVARYDRPRMAQRRARPRKRLSVFISHARRDAELALELAHELRQARLEPWLAEEKVSPGENLPRAVGRALETSDAVVVLVSSESLPGEWEYLIGSPGHAGRVLPVLTPGTSLAAVPWILKHIKHLKSGTDWRRTAREVARVLRDPEGD